MCQCVSVYADGKSRGELTMRKEIRSWNICEGVKQFTVELHIEIEKHGDCYRCRDNKRERGRGENDGACHIGRRRGAEGRVRVESRRGIQADSERDTKIDRDGDTKRTETRMHRERRCTL